MSRRADIDPSMEPNTVHDLRSPQMPWTLTALGGMIMTLSLTLIVLPGVLTMNMSADGSWPRWVDIGYSFVAFHIAACAAVGGVLMYRFPAGQRLSEIGLAATPVVPLVREAIHSLIIALPLCLVINGLVGTIFHYFDIATNGDQIAYQLEQGTREVVIMLAIGAVLIAPAAEEIMFRCVLHGALGQLLSPRVTNHVTALLFAIMHHSVELIPALYVLGLLLQHQYNRSKSLWLPILVHTGFNSVMTTMVLIMRASSLALP